MGWILSGKIDDGHIKGNVCLITSTQISIEPQNNEEYQYALERRLENQQEVLYYSYFYDKQAPILEHTGSYKTYDNYAALDFDDIDGKFRRWEKLIKKNQDKKTNNKNVKI